MAQIRVKCFEEIPIAKYKREHVWAEAIDDRQQSQ